MIVRDAGLDDILHVFRNLPVLQEVEQLAAGFAVSADDLALHICQALPRSLGYFALRAEDGAPPFALIGAFWQSPGVAALHSCTTAAIEDHRIGFWRFAVEQFVPSVLLPSVRVARASVLLEHRAMLKIVNRMGFEPHGPALPRGKRGDLFQDVTWLNPRLVDGLLPDVASNPIQGAGHV